MIDFLSFSTPNTLYVKTGGKKKITELRNPSDSVFTSIAENEGFNCR